MHASQLALSEVRGVERHDLLKALLKEVSSLSYANACKNLVGVLGCVNARSNVANVHRHIDVRLYHTCIHAQVATKLLKEEAEAGLPEDASLHEVVKQLELQRCVTLILTDCTEKCMLAHHIRLCDIHFATARPTPRTPPASTTSSSA